MDNFFIDKDLSEKIKKNEELENVYTYILSTYGWYISGDMSFKTVLQILMAIKNNNIDFAINILEIYYKENLNQIESSLISKYPNRGKVIGEAFHAHRQGLYYSSTILLLSQTDGICDGRVFRGEKVIKKYLEENSKLSIIEAVLGKESSINVVTRKQDTSNYFSDLNRHGVMHGLHIDFGNEINSLKAISLLCFVSTLLRPKK